MENHPIPQDVTGFQFKLIGEMTVKQFVYLASGIVLAWILFSLPLFWLLKWPLILMSIGMGVMLAFVPVEGRPFDVMLMNFIKALITPNQFVFQKTGYPLFPTTQMPKKPAEPTKTNDEKAKLSDDKLQKYLRAIPKSPKNSLDEKEMRFLGALPLQQSALLGTTNTSTPPSPAQATRTVAAQPIQQKEKPQQKTITVAQQPIIAQPPPQSQPIIDVPQSVNQEIIHASAEGVQNDELEKEASLIQKELAQAKQEETKVQNTPVSAVAHEKVVELEKELSDILAQKEKLQNQLITLKKELDMQKQQVFTPGVATIKKQTQNVRVIPQGLGKSIGLPITPDVPNLLTGIVKDARNNTLPNMLVEVKDRDGNPVRAFKTNGLGQFAAATQLPNGVYTLTFEDPQGKHTFDAIELPVTGTIISPLEIISIDQREELRKELFST